MKLGRIKSTLVAVALASSMATAAVAEWQPSGPIKLMIAFRAGGGVDTSARLLAEELTARHGWEIIPENVAGRGGAAMAAALKDEPADGLAIGMTAMDSLAYGVLAAKNPGFTPEDFTYLSAITGTQTGLIAKSSRGWKNLGDVIAAAKAGEEISAGAMSAKLADALYLIGQANGVEFTTVMVQGGKGGLNGVVADDLDIAWAAGPQTQGVKAGDLVNLVSAESAPLNISPDAPLLNEYNVEFTFGTKFGVVAPAGLDPEARKVLQDAIVEVVNDPESKLNQFITRAFSGPEPIAGEDFDAFMAAAREESERFLKAVE
ncbi:tripartite tricarboxylate transporter substrate-binding protein [Cognatishimia sp. SS12]|uniref:tripartite tricarboxylate transporter substrate-binding protein n=1 Tax=Cognatishimia sp. SS12 TaxID=2979465 RepID=UPI002330886E|nr:tripartite tricarboxylate transporter substrate-binding protein [Cognatishimia sp. SS12]MDC0739552.1 tripartite tricarboxylate transporter substrate-binding protein [Cognatishimia sp. SS12]